MSQEITSLVTVENGKAVTSSLKIAETFGKEHKNVIQAIRSMDLPTKFTELNFQPTQPGPPTFQGIEFSQCNFALVESPEKKKPGEFPA